MMKQSDAVFGTHTPLLMKIAALLTCITLTSCANLGTQNNEARMAKLAHSEFVISVAPKALDFKRLGPPTSNDQSIYRLVSPQYRDLAKAGNAQRNETNLAIQDPSSAILNSLNKYFQKKFQLKFIAQGLANNLDPAYIKRALKSGDYLIDLRVSELSLTPTGKNLFFLSASYQLTVIDRHRGKTIIQDTCAFTEAERAQPIGAFAEQNGLEISNALQRHATGCLRYFAQGRPETESNLSSKDNKPTKHSNSTEALFSSRATYYPKYANGSLTAFTQAVGFKWQQMQSNHWSRLASIQGLIELAAGNETSLNKNVAGASAGFGYAFHPKGIERNGVSIQFLGQTGNYRPHQWQLSTNAIGFEIATFGKLAEPVQFSLSYSAIQHVGATDKTNELGHRISLDLSIRLARIFHQNAQK